MSLPSTTSKMNKLLMRLIIAAARGDKEKVYAIAQELVKLFEEGLEEGEVKQSA